MKRYLLIFLGLTLMLAGCQKMVITRTPTPTATSTVAETATPEPSVTITATNTVTATATVTGTVITPTSTVTPTNTMTPTATLSPTLTPTVTPAPVNWLVNGRFDIGYDPLDGPPDYRGSIEGWTEANGYWFGNGTLIGLHSPLPCSESGTWYLQADRDYQGSDLWPTGVAEDTIYQVVTVPPDQINHSILKVHWEEAHHVGVSAVSLTVYGRVGSGGAWEMVYQQVGARSPSGTGKCVDPQNPIFPPPAPFTETVDVSGQGYTEYMIEVFARLIGVNDAMMWGDIKLWGE